MNNKNINIELKINSLDSSIEKMVLEKLNKKPPDSYNKINNDELNYIYNEIINNFSKSQPKNFSTQIILSIRSNFMREHMINTHRKIISKEKSIITDYNSGINLKELVLMIKDSKLDGWINFLAFLTKRQLQALNLIIHITHHGQQELSLKTIQSFI
jgi:hypothetical protein